MINDAEDIHKEAQLERKKEMKDNLVKEVGEVFKGVMHETDKILDSEKRKKVAKSEALKVKSPFIWRFQKFIKGLLILTLLLLFINFILSQIWLFKYFIGDLF